MHTGSRDLTLGPGESRTKGPLRGKEANRPRLHVILPDPCEAPILSLRLVRHVPRQASQLSNAYLPDDLAVMSSAGHVSPRRRDRPSPPLLLSPDSLPDSLPLYQPCKHPATPHSLPIPGTFVQASQSTAPSITLSDAVMPTLAFLQNNFSPQYSNKKSVFH
jgi:hypothetical protein